ncbi:putative porin [Rufibacter sediminis]|uniref:Porin n=1 Tax=Rufibacter sediminis TaxID=2762756 RepID=A0ABR6VX31_9BACT|nr:putative porin [Rufibacter sediminis]MBC3541694.1 putative porin [Rufibacter sediminis]
MTYKKLIAAAFLGWLGTYSQTQAQILNDSTKAIYGSATTKVIYEADIFKGNLTSTRIDTALTNLPNNRFWYYDSTLQQNLGNTGTASQPLFWRMPTQLGNRLGKNAFDPYAVNPATIEYYDTKSPFTFLHYLQGGLGDQIFRAKHTRNVSANWNVGIGYERLGAERQFGTIGSGLDGLVSHYGFQAFTHYASKNERYRLMANYSLSSHEQIELGGIRPERGEPIDSLFEYKEEPAWLQQATSDEKRNSFHATQWYKLLGPGLQLYHTLDVNTQNNDYTDKALPYDTVGSGDPKVQTLKFYPRAQLDGTRTYDDSYFRQIENTFGVMGSGRLFVYRAYAKRRDGSYKVTAEGVKRIPRPDLQDSLAYYVKEEKRTIADNFIGGEAQFRLKNDIYVTTDGEFQIGGGDYRLNAQARYKYLTFRQTRSSYSPTLVQRVYISNHFQWSHDFENIQANQTAATLEAGYRNHYLNAQLQFTNLRNYVYYQDSLRKDRADWATPAQTSGNTNLVQASVRYKFSVKSFVFDNNVYYNQVTGQEVIRMPEWYVQSRVYVQGPAFKKAIYVQAGVEMNWHSDYYADGYMPVTQQFHLQNDFLVTRYPTLDVFLSADIKTVNLFLKLSHLNNVISDWEQGYFTTPYYVANPFTFNLGLQWNFYD